jgi:hypothetical protein
LASFGWHEAFEDCRHPLLETRLAIEVGRQTKRAMRDTSTGRRETIEGWRSATLPDPFRVR